MREMFCFFANENRDPSQSLYIFDSAQSKLISIEKKLKL